MKELERMPKLFSRLWAEDTIAPFTDEIVKVDSAEKLELVCWILVLNSWYCELVRVLIELIVD